jgi:isoleucyl-tRNA synthetase
MLNIKDKEKIPNLRLETMPFIGEIPKDYNSKVVEEETFKFWESEKILEKVRARGGKRKFYFLDGPPYVTNPIHVGTAWNKALKDAYIRYFRMNGYDVRDQPGFDMHGLPIEVMVEKQLGIKSKKEIETLGIEKFIEACKSFAIDNLKITTNQFKNLGVWMEWESPYRTLDNYYIESVWWLIKRAEERKLLGKGKKVVHWCPRCETVLAGYEATDEYREVEEESIYVKFRIEGKENEYIMIWTTTPWTLPANVAVMVHPDLTYAKVKAGKETYIIAEGRVEQVFSGLKITYIVVETFPGIDLKGLRYVPPLLEEVPKQKELQPSHMVVLSDKYVTLEEGTGCVHTAPGHGEEDHEVGEIYGLPDFCPVDERGRFTKDGGRYAGKDVREANSTIIQDLKSKNLLFKIEKTMHRYPHCWRCKTPLIMRTASQWFIKVPELKEFLLEENEKVGWVPEWAGRARFGNWIKNAKDWVISRQRYWGIPLPIWVCDRCNEYKVIGSVSELKSKACTEFKIPELHRPWVDYVKIKCSCGGMMSRVNDVADVWMDSGSASFATLNYPSDEKAYRYWWPVDLILEGQDQTRGWFYTLMVCGVIAIGSTPYKRVLMHGFSLDQEGRAMHKSLGNVVYPEEVIERFGRDTLRWYELGCTTWEDLKFSWKAVEETSRFVGILWSTYYFASLYMSLDKFLPEKYPLEKLEKVLKPEDKWILSRFERLTQRVTESMDGLKVFESVRELEDFMKEEMSRWYVRLIRKRTWTEAEDPDKMAVYATLCHVLLNYLKMAAPIIPFASEKIYRDMFGKLPGMPESVHMLSWPSSERKWRNEEIEGDMEIVKDLIEASYSARQSARIKIRQPLLKLRIVSDEEKTRQAIFRLKDIVLEQTNVKEIDVITAKEEEDMKGVVVTANQSVLGPIFRGKTGKIAELIAALDSRSLLKSLKEGRPIVLELDGQKIELKREYISLQEKLPENFKGVQSHYGMIYIDTTKSRELIAEGLIRDIIRRIQEMRRRADLKVDAYIKVGISAPTEDSKGLLFDRSKDIAIEVRAKEVKITKGEKIMLTQREEWDIEGERFEIGIEKI